MTRPKWITPGIALILTMALLAVSLAGCLPTDNGEGEGGGGAVPTVTEVHKQTTKNTKAISDMNGKVANVEGAVKKLEQETIPNLQKSIEQSGNGNGDISGQIANITAELEALSVRIDELEGNGDGDGNGDGGTNGMIATTTWDTEGPYISPYSSARYLLNHDIDSRTIDSQKSYDISVLLYNNNRKGWAASEPASPAEDDLWLDDGDMLKWDGANWVEAQVSDVYSEVPIESIAVELVPEDFVSINEADTYVDSRGMPALGWNLNYSTLSDGTCRKIEIAATDKWYLPVPDQFWPQDRWDCPMPFELTIEFGLFYEAT